MINPALTEATITLSSSFFKGLNSTILKTGEADRARNYRLSCHDAVLRAGTAGIVAAAYHVDGVEDDRLYHALEHSVVLLVSFGGAELFGDVNENLGAIAFELGAYDADFSELAEHDAAAESFRRAADDGDDAETAGTAAAEEEVALITTAYTRRR